MSTNVQQTSTISEDFSSPELDEDEKRKDVLFREIREDYMKSKYPSQIRGLHWNTDISRNERALACTIVSQNPMRLHQLTVGECKNQPPVQYRISFVKHIIKQVRFFRRKIHQSISRPF
jgi:hypothetical protein